MARTSQKKSSVFLDRIEGEFAVLLADGKQIMLPVHLLPASAREGVYLTLTLAIDSSQTEKVKKEVEQRIQRLSAQDSGDDEIEL